MSITWIFWIGFVLIIAGAVPAGYVWYGKILKIVKKEKAKKGWLFGIIFLISACSSYSARWLWDCPKKQRLKKKLLRLGFRGCGSLSGSCWPGTSSNFSGAITGLEHGRFKTAQKAFKIGYGLVVIGMIILIWAMVPGHMVP